MLKSDPWILVLSQLISRPSGSASVHSTHSVGYSMGYNPVADNTGIFIRSAVAYMPLKSATSREILRKFELIAVQGHQRSSILVPIESALATSYSLIVILYVPLTVF